MASHAHSLVAQPTAKNCCRFPHLSMAVMPTRKGLNHSEPDTGSGGCAVHGPADTGLCFWGMTRPRETLVVMGVFSLPDGWPGCIRCMPGARPGVRAVCGGGAWGCECSRIFRRDNSLLAVRVSLLLIAGVCTGHSSASRF